MITIRIQKLAGSSVPPTSGSATFIPQMLAMNVSGRSTSADRGEHLDRVVQAMGQHRFIGRLERLDYFLVVLEDVPDRSAASEMSSK